MPNLELLKYAYSVVESAPPERIDLSRWQSTRSPDPRFGGYRYEMAKFCHTREEFDHSCGTLACGGGLLSLDPRFQDLGITTRADGTPVDSLRLHEGQTGARAFARVLDLEEEIVLQLFQPDDPDSIPSWDAEFYESRGLTTTRGLDATRYIEHILHRDLWLFRCARIIESIESGSDLNG
jgi:hypothetical protein